MARKPKVAKFACPYCGGLSTQIGSMGLSHEGHYRNVDCLNKHCEGAWIEFFDMVGIRKLGRKFNA